MSINNKTKKPYLTIPSVNSDAKRLVFICNLGKNVNSTANLESSFAASGITCYMTLLSYA